VNRGGNPPRSLTALFFTVMVMVEGYWASMTITPLLMQRPARFPAGVLYTPALFFWL
jgi:hypothetical protein